MQAPFISHVAIWVQVVPAVAYFASPRRTREGAAITIGTLASVLANVIGWIVADLAGNNFVVSYISSPVTAVCYLYAIRNWQRTSRERAWVGRIIGVFVATWIVLVWTVEEMRGFDLVTGPLYSLALLAAGAWTLVRKTDEIERTLFHRTDWFWVSLGLAVNGAATALSSQVGAILIERGRFDLFDIAWQVRAALVILSYLAMSWGVYRGPSATPLVDHERPLESDAGR